MTAAERGPALPAGLRERVMAASLRARNAGRPEPAAPEISPAEAFSRTAESFYQMLGALHEEDWATPALRGLDVQGLVGHLTGVEEDMHRSLAGDLEVADARHVESTQAAAARQAGRSPARIQVGPAVQDVGAEDHHAAGREGSAREAGLPDADPRDGPGGRVQAQRFPHHPGRQVEPGQVFPAGDISAQDRAGLGVQRGQDRRMLAEQVQ